jgi:predicted ribosome quality control (RQC) complex YloA/Tae2 family protein
MEPMNSDLPKKTDADAECDARLAQVAAAARRKLTTSIAKQRKLISNLSGDLARHGDPEKWKRFGDLLLANASSATRKGDRIVVTDYFDDSAPTIEIEGDANRSVSEIAESYFRLYTKARNGLSVISERITKTEAAIKKLEADLAQLEAAIAAEDREFLAALVPPVRKLAPVSKKKKAEAAFKGARRFISSDGFSVLVGKKAKDNDYLTFRMAGSLDLWLHAADYPGSHVVIRNPNRVVVPVRTLTEAAELAAFYSDAREQPKAAVRYTQKKFVNKPRKSAPGLVSLASFKTILVEPKVAVKLATK